MVWCNPVRLSVWMMRMFTKPQFWLEASLQSQAVQHRRPVFHALVLYNITPILFTSIKVKLLWQRTPPSLQTDLRCTRGSESHPKIPPHRWTAAVYSASPLPPAVSFHHLADNAVRYLLSTSYLHHMLKRNTNLGDHYTDQVIILKNQLIPSKYSYHVNLLIKNNNANLSLRILCALWNHYFTPPSTSNRIMRQHSF